MRVVFHEEITGAEVGGLVAPTESLTTELCGKPEEVAMLSSFLGFTPPPPPPPPLSIVEIKFDVPSISADYEDDDANLDLLYLRSNYGIPTGRVSSTARRGDKWYNQVDVGDIVNLRTTEDGDKIGEAVIVQKELVTLKDVLDNADHNHVAFSEEVNKHVGPAMALAGQLQAAYGTDLKLTETFSVLHILPLNT